MASPPLACSNCVQGGADRYWWLVTPIPILTFISRVVPSTVGGFGRVARMEAALQLTIDCREPERLVDFWQPLTGYEVPPPPAPYRTWRDFYISIGETPETITGDGRDRLRPANGEAGIPIWFQEVPESKTIKNRLHLDLRVSAGVKVSRSERRAAIEGVVADVVARGGHLLRWWDDEESDRVNALMSDPEGNEFCLM